MADPQTQTSAPGSGTAGTVGAELIPRSVLFGNPERVAPRISPDGGRLAWIAPDQDVLNVWVQDLADGAGPPRVVTADRDRGIRVFYWAPDDVRILYLQDKGGDENWRLYDVNLDTGENRDLTPYDKVQVQVIGIDPDIQDRVLVAINKDDERLHDVYQLSLDSGELTKVVANPGFVGWTVDAQLGVRAAMAPRPDGGLTLMVRDHVEADWRPLLEVAQVDSMSTQPLGFDADGGRLLMISSADANAARLIWLDVATGAVEVIAADDSYDVSDAWLERRSRRPLMVAFARDRLEWQVLDDSVTDDLAALKALDDGDLSLLGRTRDESVQVVAYDHADGPGRFYRYDRAGRTGSFLFENRPDLASYTLAPMEPFQFTSRDGLTIHGYLAFPAGYDPASAERAGGNGGTGLPTVLNVHGGPWGRDTWRFHPEVQWLANRGYLCVQVNFRGSTGYGKDFVNAGDREWGARMHDDLVDAVQHVVGLGHADPQKVAIYGGSYGGYAALVGATFTPDLFCCAVDIVGPSNLATLIASIPAYWEPLIAEFHTRVGNPQTEADFMWSRSPLSKVDAIKIPLMIAQGANDPRVKVAESEQIVAALTEKGIPHEYLLFPDEGHGFAKPENRLTFYAAAEKFLAEHLGGRFEA
jgi:dipeptidyl aminopeptidase/acylaminoacyl peptidase